MPRKRAYVLVRAAKDSSLAELAQRIFELEWDHAIVVRVDQIADLRAVMAPVDALDPANYDPVIKDILALEEVHAIIGLWPVKPEEEGQDPHYPTPGPPDPKKDDPNAEDRNAWG